MWTKRVPLLFGWGMRRVRAGPNDIMSRVHFDSRHNLQKDSLAEVRGRDGDAMREPFPRTRGFRNLVTLMASPSVAANVVRPSGPEGNGACSIAKNRA